MSWNQLRPGLWVGDYRVPGLPCRSTAVALDRDDAAQGFIVYSPGSDLLEPFADVGEARFVLAPNNFHHYGIPAWQASGAHVVVSEGAQPRLRKQGIRDMFGLDAIRRELPDHLQILEPAGTRIGETWLRMQTAEGVAWVVGDALFNLPRLPKKPMLRLAMKTLRSGPGLSMSRLMKWGGLNDRPAFKRWITQQLEQDAPNLLVTCHGDLLEADDLPSQISAAVQARLG